MSLTHLKFILFFLLSFSTWVNAEKLPDDHFLAPRDLEPLTLNGIERLGGNNFWKRKVENCTNGHIHMACSLKLGIERSSEANEFFKKHSFADITFFGETHTKLSIQKAFVRLIESLSDKKVRALGLEMFNETSQPMLNQYLSGMITLDEVIKVLESEWNYKSTGYREILKVAKEKGLHIIALDNRPEFRRLDLGAGLLERDKVMARNLINYRTEFPNHKILVYSGKLHAFRSLSEDASIQTISEIFDQAFDGITRESYLFFQRKSSSPPSVVREVMQTNIQEDIVINVPGYDHYIDGLILLK